MRCIFTNRTMGIGCFSIGTNGDPSYHHEHQWSLCVSIGQPSNYGTMSQVLLQLVVTVRRGVCFSSGFNLAPSLFLPGINWYGVYYMM